MSILGLALLGLSCARKEYETISHSQAISSQVRGRVGSIVLGYEEKRARWLLIDERGRRVRFQVFSVWADSVESGLFKCKKRSDEFVCYNDELPEAGDSVFKEAGSDIMNVKKGVPGKVLSIRLAPKESMLRARLLEETSHP